MYDDEKTQGITIIISTRTKMTSEEMAAIESMIVSLPRT